ncbi:MAG: hypothetical protein NC485_14625 [Ruminococcus flavefaciens]|nr:hypothetical protein [Ruminococcus flavefaciens]
MKKLLSILLLLSLLCAVTVTLIACGDKTEKTTLEKFAQDWYAYTMTTITDGVESEQYGEFEGILYEGSVVYNDFVRFYL